MLFGTPELLDPGVALGLGGILVAVSLILTLSIILGFIACFMGISGLLACYGLDLPNRLDSKGD